MKFRQAFLSAALLVSGAALAQGGQPMTQPSTQATRQSASVQKLVPSDPQQFAQHLHHSNQLEVRLGQLAQQKAESDQVKEFGRRMVDDHSKADENLKTLAKTQKWNLQKEPKPTNNVERAMSDAEKANEAKLRQLDGAAFDAAYMALMVSDHDLDVMKVTQAAQQFKGTEFATQLNQLAPILLQHRDQAHRVLGQLKPQQMGVGGAGDTGGMQTPDTQKGSEQTGGSGEMGTEMQDDSGNQQQH